MPLTGNTAKIRVIEKTKNGFREFCSSIYFETKPI